MRTPRPITEWQLALLKPLARWMSAIHTALYRMSAGGLGGRFGGGDVCLVRMVGARSRREMEIPLMYVPYRDGVILVASFAGAPRHPSWYHNLVANPRIEVTWKNQRKTLLARRASAEEKAAVWPLCCQHYKDFDLYQRRTGRDIPVFICEPMEAV